MVRTVDLFASAYAAASAFCGYFGNGRLFHSNLGSRFRHLDRDRFARKDSLLYKKIVRGDGRLGAQLDPM